MGATGAPDYNWTSIKKMSTKPQNAKRKAVEEPGVEVDDDAPSSAATTSAAPAPKRVKKTTAQDEAAPPPKRSHKKKAPGRAPKAVARAPPKATRALPPTTPHTTPPAGPCGEFTLSNTSRVNHQELFIVMCRANLVPGATGPKDWAAVTAEFNEMFKEELRKALAWNTLSRRGGIAKKKLIEDNPGFEQSWRYPIPASVPATQLPVVEEEREDEVVDGEMEVDEPDSSPPEGVDTDMLDVVEPLTEKPTHHMLEATAVEHQDTVAEEPSTETASVPLDQPQKSPAESADQQKLARPVARRRIAAKAPRAMPTAPSSEQPQVEQSQVEQHQQEQIAQEQIAQEQIAQEQPVQVPGAYHPAAVSEHHISPIDRAMYHLRRRTAEPISFRFLSRDATTLTRNDPQYVDHDTLTAVSPYALRTSREDPDTPIDVPEHFTAQTVNIFLQLVSPSCTTSLPTHYLWKSGKPVPGVYDRFGAINPEKIAWSIDALLDLHAFAGHMEVSFIRDMVLDRIHWMYTAQTAMKKAYADVLLQHNKAGRKAGAGFQMPRATDLGFSLAAEDFETEHLDLLATEEPMDVQAITFIADIMHALGGAPDDEWVENAPEAVKEIFANAPHGSSVKDASRAQFCARYHHHAEPGECYTALPTHSLSWYNHNLYTTSSREELVKLSTGLSTDTVKAANSTPGMVAAEKMMVEMEMRLEEAKKILERARGARTENEKGPMIGEIKKMLRLAKVASRGMVG